MPALPGHQSSGSGQAGRPGHRAATSAAGTAPDIGRPLPEMPELRELAIAFVDSGYVALYRHEAADDGVYILGMSMNKFRQLAARMGQQIQTVAAEGISTTHAIVNRTRARCWASHRSKRVFSCPIFHAPRLSTVSPPDTFCCRAKARPTKLGALSTGCPTYGD